MEFEKINSVKEKIQKQPAISMLILVKQFSLQIPAILKISKRAMIYTIRKFED